MFAPFFLTLRKTGVPVCLRGYPGFAKAMAAGLVSYDLTGFYPIARTITGQDERERKPRPRVGDHRKFFRAACAPRPQGAILTRW